MKERGNKLKMRDGRKKQQKEVNSSVLNA